MHSLYVYILRNNSAKNSYPRQTDAWILPTPLQYERRQTITSQMGNKSQNITTEENEKCQNVGNSSEAHNLFIGGAVGAEEPLTVLSSLTLHMVDRATVLQMASMFGQRVTINLLSLLTYVGSDSYIILIFSKFPYFRSIPYAIRFFGVFSYVVFAYFSRIIFSPKLLTND